MADGTDIEWTDATWNPVTGCSIKSPGCIHCYAQTLAGTRLRNHPSRAGLTDASKNGPVFNGKVRFNEQWLDLPLRWRRRPRRIFVCAHGDLFHENVPDEWIDRVFAVMALSPQHQFQVLTKRAERMREYLSISPTEICERIVAAMGHKAICTANDLWTVWPLPNVWLGVSCERQQEADERIPHLLATPAAKRFISAEPLLGRIDLRFSIPSFLDGEERPLMRLDALRGVHSCGSAIVDADAKLDWVIAGGESGKKARPMHPDWARSLRDQCADAGVPFFFKQWGEWGDVSPGDPHARLIHPDGSHEMWSHDAAGKPDCVAISAVGKKAAGRLLDGCEHSEFPAAREDRA
jgi:protein gp37